jgi:hypothetical protein
LSPRFVACSCAATGDIERIFGTKVEDKRSTDSDHLYRSIVPMVEVELALARAVKEISYKNFKDSVKDHELHHAYLKTWTAMSELQHPTIFAFTGKR